MANIYLTIDDGPTSNTSDIIDYLKTNNIFAIMFFVGMNIEKNYDIAVKAVKSGMIIGNHSYSHCDFSKIDNTVAEQEIGKTDALIDKIHQDAGIERKYRLFRYPYGSCKMKVDDILKKYNYDVPITLKSIMPNSIKRSIGWTYNPKDWNIASAIYQNKGYNPVEIKKRLRVHSTYVMVAHDNERLIGFLSAIKSYVPTIRFGFLN